MTDGTLGHGLVFERSGDGTSTGTFAALGEVVECGPPSLTRDTVDVTHFESTGKWREFIGGLRDGGEVSLGILYKSSGTVYSTLLADLQATASGYYRITFRGGDTLAFAALVTNLGQEVSKDGAMTVTTTFKVTGKPVYTAAP